jgi:hypothetical protein
MARRYLAALAGGLSLILAPGAFAAEVPANIAAAVAALGIRAAHFSKRRKCRVPGRVHTVRAVCLPLRRLAVKRVIAAATAVAIVAAATAAAAAPCLVVG